MRRMRTFEKKEEDRNNILIVMKQAKDWVRPGWVCKRITTSTRNLVHHDLIAMVSGGTLERTAKPFRYAIAGTERGYELGYPKDQGYLQAKILTNGKYDPDWIRNPNRRNIVAGIDQNDPRNIV